MNLLWSWIDLNAVSFTALEVIAKLTLVLGAIALLGLLTHFTAATKRLLWSAAVVIALLFPLAGGLLPTIEVPVAAVETSPPREQPLIAAPPVTAPSSAFRQTLTPIPQQTNTSPLPNAEMSNGITWWFTWQNALALAVVIWVLGTAFFAARLWSQYRLARTIRKGATPFSRESYNNVPLLSNDDIATPVALGVLKPVIILPAAARQWDAAKLRAAIAHELAHVRGQDNLIRFCASILCALYWFHPLVWYSARKLHEEQEKAADNAVINQGVRASTYAQNLLDIVRSLQGNSYDSNVSTSMASYSFFPQRMRSILSESQNRQGPGMAQAALVILFIGAIALPLTLLTTQATPVHAQEATAENNSATEKANENPDEERTLYLDFAQNTVTEENPRPDSQPAPAPSDPIDPPSAPTPQQATDAQPVLDPAQAAPFQELETQMAAAFNRRDVNALLSFYSDDALVLIENNGPPNQTYQGTRAIRNYWNDLLSSDMMLRSQVQAVDRDGDKARVTSRYWVSFGTEIGNLNDFFGGVTTTEWQRIDGEWRIVNDVVHEPDYVSDESIQRIVDTALGAVEAVDWEGISRSISEAITTIGKDFDFDIDIDFDDEHLNLPTRDANNPLLNAVESGNSKSVTVLLENGADANATARWGRSALYLASEMGNKETVEQLLKYGADVNAASRYGKTPLYVAAENGHLEVVKLLVEDNAKVNQLTRYGKSPLSAAAAGGHDAVVEYLLEQGADVNA